MSSLGPLALSIIMQPRRLGLIDGGCKRIEKVFGRPRDSIVQLYCRAEEGPRCGQCRVERIKWCWHFIIMWKAHPFNDFARQILAQWIYIKEMKQNRENQIQREKKKNKKAERKRQKKRWILEIVSWSIAIAFHCRPAIADTHSHSLTGPHGMWVAGRISRLLMQPTVD